MKTLLVIMSLTFANVISYSKDVKHELLDTYLEIKNALVQSDAVTTMQKSKAAYNQLSTAPAFPNSEIMLKHLYKMATTDDINKQRKAMSQLSVVLWNTIKTDTSITMKLYYDYCPMKDMYWISEFEEIQNPYYGNRMLSCGSVAETKN